MAEDSSSESTWSGVVTSFGRFLITATGVPGGGAAFNAAVDLIRAIEGAQDAQTEMLNAIRQDVELLRHQAFKGGKLRLEEVARVGPESDRYVTLLEEAASRFLDAESMCDSLEESAVNELYLGLTLSLLNNRNDALHWLRLSAETGTDAARELAKAAANIKVYKSKKTVALSATVSAVLYPAAPVVLTRVYLKKRKLKREAHATVDVLAGFLPFVNAAVSCHNSLGLEAPMPTLELAQTGKTSWALQESPGEQRPMAIQ
jgi:hypothetical protein